MIRRYWKQILSGALPLLFISSTFRSPLEEYEDIDPLKAGGDSGFLCANVPMGWLSPGYEKLVGVHFFYDYRSINKGSFHQLNLAAELLKESSDLQINKCVVFRRKETPQKQVAVTFPSRLERREEYQSATAYYESAQKSERAFPQPPVQVNELSYGEGCSFYCSEPSFLMVIPAVFYRGGSGRGYKGGYEGAEAFVAWYDGCSHSYPFIDVDVLRAGGSRTFVGANVGAGWRWLSPGYKSLFGVNVFYDYLGINNGNLHQVGLGAELLGECWDVRINGYIPFGSKWALQNTTVFAFPGGAEITRKEYQSAMWGLDVEIGKYLFCLPCVDIYGGIGPYFYNSVACCGSLIGGMGRLAAVICRNFWFEALVTYDHVYKTKVQGEIYLSIPFSVCADTCAWSCIFPRLFRNNVIVSDPVCCFSQNF